MFKKTMSATMALVLFAGPIAAQEAATSGETEVVAEAFARVEAEGIPRTLLESKLAEGRAKGVSAARIEAAIEQRADALIRASNAFAEAGVENASEADLSVAADAIQGGVSIVALQSVSSSATTERRAVAIATLTHLVAEGVVTSEALVRIETAMESGPQALADLATSVGVTGEVGVGAGVSGGVDAGVGGGLNLP